ncbi:ATP-binding protein [Anaerocolumna sp. MB42-C2]|uniref:ATP-binding protein n=1 Tax=Anaerocolumna sp. MB42-C2 TaxID=3070997 RepID=UPI0027DFEE9F|nr:sensor histidine kinase [Anaerocolumna sp. MB42-C2]WMJ89080.1 GHKL domain-containing protein [Anaerocolumna sp. MB42-C2]
MNNFHLSLIRYFLINTFDLYVILRYYSKVFGKSKAKKSAYIGSIIVLLIIFTVFIEVEVPYVNLLNISTWSLIYLLFYKESVSKRIIYGIILLALAGCCQSVSYFLYNTESNPNLNVISLSHLLFFFLLELAARVGKFKPVILYKSLWKIILTIPVSSIVTMPCILILALNSRISVEKVYLFLIPTYINIIYVNIIAFYLFDKLSVLIDTLKTNAILEQQVQYQAKYYLSMHENMQTIRNIKHDMKNNLEAIQCLLKENKISDVQNLIVEITDSVIEADYLVSTDNPAIDTILNVKLAIAREKKIKVDKIINIPQKLNISYAQSAAILGNLLDNAIEGTEKLDIDDRYFQIKMNYINNSLFIGIKNTYSLKELNGSLETNKSDKLLHGIGLMSAKKTAEEFGGLLETKSDSNYFYANILLYFYKDKVLQ